MDRHQQVEELFHAALERASGERATFLAQECGSDLSLLAEVSSLIAEHEQPGDLINAPALKVAAELWATPEPGLRVGQSLGHYQVLSSLGAGGMGEVYLAQDTRLDRKVALKLLPAEATRDPDRLRRFVREAKAISALNHPNII